MNRQTSFIIASVLIAAFSSAGFADITVNTVTTAASPGTTDGFSGLTFEHAIGGASDRVLIVAVCREGNEANPEQGIDGVTYAGVPMTPIPGASIDVVEGVVSASNDIFYLLESDLPASGAYDVVITLPSNASWICAAAIALNNVVQAAPEAAGTNSTTDPDDDPQVTTSVTTTTPGAWLIDAVMSGAGAENSTSTDEFVPIVAGMTKRGYAEARSATMAMASRVVETPGQASMGWQKVGNAFRLAHSVIAVAPLPGGGEGEGEGEGELPVGGTAGLMSLFGALAIAGRAIIKRR